MNFDSITSYNPNKNYTQLATKPATSAEDILKAIKNARGSFESYKNLTIQKRTEYLLPLYQIFEKEKEKIAQSIAQEIGMSYSSALTFDVEMGLEFFKTYLESAQQWLKVQTVFENNNEIHQLHFQPRGTVASSIAWNYPFSNFIWSVIQNLVAGNCIIIKHSEQCLQTAMLIDSFMQQALLPAGIYTMVYGSGAQVGQFLMEQDIDMIWFVGSVAVGKKLYQTAAQKQIPVVLELGGSAAGIVLEDADLATSIPSIIQNRFINNGQTCDGLKRLYVHQSLFDRVIKELKQELCTKKIGSALDHDTFNGPIVSTKQHATIINQINDAQTKKGTVHQTGIITDNGLTGCIPFTLITNISDDMLVVQEEVFGPVLPIIPFKTINEAIEKANCSNLGLGGYIYGNNLSQAEAVALQLNTGNISINGTNYVIAQDTFGGYKHSGIGTTHGAYGMQQLCHTKIIAQPKK